LQQLAAKFGSKITQHFYNHEQSTSRNNIAHDIWTVNNYIQIENTKLSHDFKKSEELEKRFKIGVNSFHHQGVLFKNLGEDLVPLYLADNEDSYHFDHNEQIVEAFIHKNLPIAAVQFHPEDMPGERISKQLINHLLGIENLEVERYNKYHNKRNVAGK